MADPACVDTEPRPAKAAPAKAASIPTRRTIKASRSFSKMSTLSAESLKKLLLEKSVKKSPSVELTFLLNNSKMLQSRGSLGSLLSNAKNNDNQANANEVFNSSDPMMDFTPGSKGQSPLSFLLDEMNARSSETVRTVLHLNLDGVFQPITREQRNTYENKQVLEAIHNQNVELLRTWHAQGRTLQGVNDFGESLLHLACRRGYLDVVTFLIEEAKLNVWACDDTGRSPLHYACWTREPSFDLVDFLIKQDQDLLYVIDKRGHAPLDYTREEHWKDWIDHLEGTFVMNELLPQRRQFYDNRSAKKMKLSS